MHPILKILFNKIFIIYFFIQIPIVFAGESEDFNTSDNSKVNKISKINKFLEQDFYILGAGDILEIEINQAKELSRQVNVLSDGSISIPIIGNVYVKGLTISMASEKLENLLRKELINPDMQITVIKARPIRVSLIGEVTSPGVYTLSNTEQARLQGRTEVNIKGTPRLVDALQKAGGLTKKADLDNVSLLRILPGETNLKYKKGRISLLNIIKKGSIKDNPVLFDGDIIEINEVESKSISENSKKIARGNLSAQTISIYVVGEVVNPGKLTISSNSSLRQGILAAGGLINVRAKKTNIKLLRVDDQGYHQFSKYNLNFAKDLSDKKNPILLEGDTVLVGRNNLGVATDAVGAVAKPISSLVQVWSLIRLIND